MAVGQEVVVAASAGPESSLHVWDIKSGASLPGFKNNCSGRNSLCKVGDGCLAAAQRSQGIVRFWNWDQASAGKESFLPEAIQTISATIDGCYFIAGGQSGTLYVWEIGTARLLRSWPAHYKAVTSLSVVGGGSAFVSAGEDAIINVWLLAKVLGNSSAESRVENPTPLHSWSDHTLPVTSLHCGFGGINGILVSSSLDYSCKIRQVSSGVLLRSIKFPACVLCSTTDQGDHHLYAGGKNGVIFAVSLVGSTGSEDGSVRLWDLQTEQCVRVWESSNRQPITALLVVCSPPVPTINQRNNRKTKRTQIGMLGLNKYQSGPGRGDLNPWDGCPVAKNKFIKYTGIAIDCGLLLDSSAKNDGWCMGTGDIDAEKELREAKQMSQRLWDVNQQLLQFCEDKIMAPLEGLSE